MHAESVFVNFLRTPGIDSQPGGIDSSELIPGLHSLQIRALIYKKNITDNERGPIKVSATANKQTKILADLTI
jgi:hypothetical protein